jgi:transglutaminase-like putative cysteine protease
MPRLHAKHRTEIRYAGSVGESVNEIRLVPSGNGRQQVEWSHVRTEPAAELLGHRDAYGNEVRWFQLTEPHGVLVVEAEAVVTTRPGLGRPQTADAGIAAIAEPAYIDDFAEFLSGSTHIRWVEPVEGFARGLALDESGSLVQWGASLESQINAASVYTPGVTEVGTPVEEVVRVGRGV